MPNKKDKPEPEAPSEEKILEERVDAMMDPKRPEEVSPVPVDESEPQAADEALPPLDIFAGASSAPDVPKELVVKGAKTQNNSEQAPEPEETADVPSEPQLDDSVSDAAVDDIVAHESDTVLAAEDTAIEQQKVTAPRPRKIHHHPVFWTLVALIAIVAVATAFLFVSGGNWQLPGPLQSLKNSISR